jgi:hypothetical protein
MSVIQTAKKVFEAIKDRKHNNKGRCAECHRSNGKNRNDGNYIDEMGFLPRKKITPCYKKWEVQNVGFYE